MELLVVIALLAMLALLLLPAQAQVKTRSQGIGCLNNLKQLALASHLYAGDNQDAIPPNSVSTSENWVLVQSGVKTIPDYTNVMLVRNGLLYPYAKSVALYQCPGDYDLLPNQTQPRVRNYSMNGMMGNNLFNTFVHPSTKEHITFSTVTNPGPASASFFVDEQSSALPAKTSIDDGYFAVNDGTSGDYMSSVWRNVPSSRHGNFGQFSYADGHAAIMKWLEPDTHLLQGINASSAEPNNLDRHQVWLSTYGSGTVPGVPW